MGNDVIFHIINLIKFSRILLWIGHAPLLNECSLKKKYKYSIKERKNGFGKKGKRRNWDLRKTMKEECRVYKSVECRV